MKDMLHKILVNTLNVHWRVISAARFVTHRLPESISTQFWYFYLTGRFLNLKTPASLTEKINWLKLHRKNPAFRKYIDRELVRHYVAQKSPDCLMAKILLKSKSLSEEQWLNLPERFVLKASHGAGMVKIIKNKADTSFEDIQALTEEWLSLDYSKLYREWVYKDLERYILAEEFLSDSSGEIPSDFKFYCLNGIVGFVCVDTGRFSQHQRSLFDRNFNLLDATLTYPKGSQIKIPPVYEKAREIAENLASELTFARVDLYLLEGSVYFGEITLIPAAGRLNFSPLEFDMKMGERLDLNR